MPDKEKPNEAISDDSLPVPRRPPAQPKKDYSSLPQKPITLKSRVDSPPALKRVVKKAKGKPRATPKPPAVPKPVKHKPSASTNEWTVQGVSQEAREAATAAAEREGVRLSEWLEQLILQGPQPAPEASQPDPALMQSLKSIDERLDRIENQKGFWVRFWERFMEQH